VWTMEDAVSALKRQGAKITSQRLAILRLLQGRRDHPSAECVYQELKGEFPTISFATIYSTTQLLAQAGLIQILTVDNKRVHFDPNPEPHAHYHCIHCGMIHDIPLSERTVGEILQHTDFQVDQVQIYLYGVCPECLKGLTQ